MGFLYNNAGPPVLHSTDGVNIFQKKGNIKAVLSFTYHFFIDR